MVINAKTGHFMNFQWLRASGFASHGSLDRSLVIINWLLKRYISYLLTGESVSRKEGRKDSSLSVF